MNAQIISKLLPEVSTFVLCVHVSDHYFTSRISKLVEVSIMLPFTVFFIDELSSAHSVLLIKIL